MERVIFLFLRRMRAPLLTLIISYAVSITGLVLIPGVDAQGQVWHYDFFHAFYFISFMGTTIGFGEIPYELVPAQRMWVAFSIYLTVISWLFALGKIFALVQDQAFIRAITEARFIRAVRKITEPFYIVCGYGETGSLVVRALVNRGIRCVVIDDHPDHIANLQLEELSLDVPCFCGDASSAQHLKEAGLNRIGELVDMLVERQIGAVFVESSVSDRNIRALIEGAAAKGHAVRVGGEVYSDAMGPDGTYEGTYLGMLDHNISTIAGALGGDVPPRGMDGKLSAGL